MTVTIVNAYRINAGGVGIPVDPYAGDQYYSGGTVRTITSSVDMTSVADPAPMAVYQKERWGAITYTLPNLASGVSYTVRLHFVESYWTAVNKRLFHVNINGTRVLTNFDIYAIAGARYKAIVREFTATANASGQIVIQWITFAGKDNPTIQAIQIKYTALRHGFIMHQDPGMC